jgi:RRXRR protein
MYPFTIRLVDRESGEAQPLALKLDPGSKQTGIALVRESGATATVVALMELKHRGAAIRKALQQRAGLRHRSSIASIPSWRPSRACARRHRARPSCRSWFASICS